MAATRSATYKIYNGTDWDTYYFATSAAQVGESSTLKFLRPATHTVNGKSFLNGTTHQGITLYSTDIKRSSSDGTTIDDILTTIGNQIASIGSDYVSKNGGTVASLSVSTTFEATSVKTNSIQSIGAGTSGAMLAFTPDNTKITYTSNAANAGIADYEIATKKDIADLVNSAPEALNTLGELATALNNHEDAYDALLETVGGKADSNHTHTEYVSKTGDGTISGSLSVQRAITSSSLATGMISSTGSSSIPGIYFTNEVVTYGPSSVVGGDTKYEIATKNDIYKTYLGSATPTGMKSGDIWLQY